MEYSHMSSYRTTGKTFNCEQHCHRCIPARIFIKLHILKFLFPTFLCGLDDKYRENFFFDIRDAV